MRVGISVTSSHNGFDDRAAVSRVIEQARVAGEVGLDHLSLGDHHATGHEGPYVQNIAMLGRLIADWPPDRSIGCLFLMPLWHPVTLAAQVGTLAAMIDAPFIVQTGLGYGQPQFDAMGANIRRRGRLTDVAITAVKGLLAGETVDVPEWGIQGAAVRPIPPVPVEWWIGASVSPVPLNRAVTQGDAWYLHPGLGGDALVDGIADYRQRCEEAGVTPRVILRRNVLVADDARAAQLRAATLAGSDGAPGRYQPWLAGGVSEVTEQLAELAELGVDDVVIRSMVPDQAESLRSIELVGEARRALI